MLFSLSLKNLATISDTSFELSKGLNVLTGETGSGKSILVDGLMLTLGARADKTLVRPGTQNAFVEAVFHLPDNDDLIIRREINTKGRSRVFINDALSTLDEVKQIVTQLVALHSQSSTPNLLKPVNQLEILDSFACIENEMQLYQNVFKKWLVARNELNKLQEFLVESKTTRALLLFEVEAFNTLQPTLDDYNSLQDERLKINRVSKLSSFFNETLEALYGDSGVSDVLSSILYKTQAEDEKIGLTDLNELLMQASISIEEAANFIQSKIEDIEDSSALIPEIDQRLDEYSKLIARCGGSVVVMLEYKASLLKKLNEFDEAEQQFSKLMKILPNISEELVALAEKISTKRKLAAKKFKLKVVSELKLLNMKHAEFSVAFGKPTGGVSVNKTILGQQGKESISFLFSANTGIPVNSLDTIASGGELSRVALAVALTLANSASSETLIFDEIDAGTGGETAHSLAESLLRASKNRQIIVISHLAQIASRANRHLAVAKEFENGMPITRVIPLLAREQQLTELARLLGGGEGAYKHAESLFSEFGT